MKTIGEIIRKLRESKKISAKELCEKLSINPSTYSKLENNKKSIDVDELKKLTTFFGVSADHILGISEPQSDIVLYMQRDKKLETEDINEIEEIFSMMDEAISLKSMLSNL